MGNMTSEDYKFLYSQLDKNNIPNEIYTKIIHGEELNSDDEKQLKLIIEKEQPKQPIIVQKR